LHGLFSLLNRQPFTRAICHSRENGNPVSWQVPAFAGTTIFIAGLIS
jgi:hypothetical protein